MNKIIFWGDGLLAGSLGYAELLAHHIFLHHPQADVTTAIFGGGPLMWSDVVRETPLHVIGKAPDLVILGFGGADLAGGIGPDESAHAAQSAVHLMLQKTHTRICILSLVSSFFAHDGQREACHSLNRKLQALSNERVAWVDLDSSVENFLDEHRHGPGEKHSLHLDAMRLSPLGKLFLAHHAFQLIPWPKF